MSKPLPNRTKRELEAISRGLVPKPDDVLVVNFRGGETGDRPRMGGTMFTPGVRGFEFARQFRRMGLVTWQS